MKSEIQYSGHFQIFLGLGLETWMSGNKFWFLINHKLEESTFERAQPDTPKN